MRISDWVQTCALPICPAGRVDPAQAAQALADAVRELGLDALPWSEGLRQWRARVLCLREWMPELGLPDLGDETLLATLRSEERRVGNGSGSTGRSRWSAYT